MWRKIKVVPGFYVFDLNFFRRNEIIKNKKTEQLQVERKHFE